MYHLSIFIFRRDIRLYDNNGLIEALKNSEKVIPIFIFTPEQLVNNKYKSDNSVQFMMESLEDLEKQIKEKKGKIYYFYGEPSNVINKILKNNKKIDAIYLNMDYSPYSIKRDKLIKEVCEKNKIDFNSYEDILLNKVGSIKTSDEKTYTKFTPYFNKAKKIKIEKPKDNRRDNYFKNEINDIYEGSKTKFYKKNDKLLRNGGRKEGLKILKNISNYKDYNKIRNCLEKHTTQLSAYIKFGCLSIREIYWEFHDKLGISNELIKQLYWRDFYYNIMYSYPNVIGGNMKKEYDKIKWINNSSWFNKWKQGKTGFPIVDAGMREMNNTGFMHNRSRMIVSNFMIKLLGINWQKGEKYFATKLYDYDVANNNGGWQWSSSSGADSQPYFRIFNPWLQSKKFDPNGIYIKKWIPELSNVNTEDLHKWDITYKNYKVNYPKPMIDYKKQREKILKLYKKSLN
jgi:deoxyribodipyrimidine photo-lyase